ETKRWDGVAPYWIALALRACKHVLLAAVLTPGPASAAWSPEETAAPLLTKSPIFGLQTKTRSDGAEKQGDSHAAYCNRSRRSEITNLCPCRGRHAVNGKTNHEFWDRFLSQAATPQQSGPRNLCGSFWFRRHSSELSPRSAGGSSSASQDTRSRLTRSQNRSARCSDPQSGVLPSRPSFSSCPYRSRTSATQYVSSPGGTGVDPNESDQLCSGLGPHTASEDSSRRIQDIRFAPPKSCSPTSEGSPRIHRANACCSRYAQRTNHTCRQGATQRREGRPNLPSVNVCPRSWACHKYTFRGSPRRPNQIQLGS